MSSSFGPSNVRLSVPAHVHGRYRRKTDTNEQQAMRFTRTGESPDLASNQEIRGVCDRLSLASQLMVLSDTSLEQVWLVPLLLALKSGLPTNTTASFLATAALARAYVNLSFALSPC